MSRSIPLRAGWVLLLFLAAASALMRTAPGFAAESAIPRPAALERDVQFWIRVYTEITTNAGFLHDERNLAVVYETLRFAPNTPSRERQKAVDAARDRYVAALRRIATATGPLSAEDQRIRDMWGEEGTPIRLLEATSHVRFQLGQADRFREGLVRSGAWETHIAETFANLGLPAELAVLPHVESSFNAAAYSKVGAAGLWQFMRSTGRRYLRIDDDVDDRLDPFRSTEAAAQLLSYNYRLLGTWPLALTAYNHGAAGMRRAKEAMGTDDIVQIVRHHRSPSFGFASRNFYVSFLAALEIDRNPEKYFGPVERAAERKFAEVALPAYVPLATLERILATDRELLRELNPALLPPVWDGRRHVPKGYRLRLPAGGETWTSELLALRIPGGGLFAGQPRPRVHRVARGDTLSGIAARHGVSVAALAALNDMRPSSPLRPGRTLQLPGTPSPGVSAAAAPAVKAATGEAPDMYVVRRGDSLSEIARKVNLTEADLLRINRIRDPDYIFEGQQLLLAAVPTAPEAPAAPAGSPAGAQAPAAAGVTERGGRVSAAVAEQESAEDAAAVAAVGKPAAKAEPVSAAQAEALGPALGPAVETPQTPDPFDYTVGKDDSIVVAAAETLGHYAEWLGTSAARLREINRMRYGRPVLLGQKVRLEFRKVQREAFEQQRREYHRTLQASYFAAHRIAGTEVYIARRGDSLWTVTQRYSRMPIWLLQQYNPDVDLSELRPGVQIVVPRIQEIVSAGG